MRAIGVIERNEPASDNDWEQIKNAGDNAIKNWIDEQMHYRSCTVVLVGSETANRKWIKYEITESWNKRMGVVGIYIHGLKDQDGNTSSKGKNPFDSIKSDDGEKLSSVVKCFQPTGSDSKSQYNWIADNISNIIEEAISIRDKSD